MQYGSITNRQRGLLKVERDIEMHMVEYPEIMTVGSLAYYLGISKATVYQYATTGLLPAFKLGNRWRFSKKKIDEWVARQSDVGQEERKHELRG